MLPTGTEAGNIRITHQLSHSESTITNPNAVRVQQLFIIPEFASNKNYKAKIRELAALLGEFDKFTDNLEAKVDALLAAQQQEFVESYKQHMRKVEAEFKVLVQKQVQQDELIKYYENQGKMSNLVKKVAKLEQESKDLYAVIEKKDKKISALELENKVQKQENKRIFVQLKQMLKVRNELQVKIMGLQGKDQNKANPQLIRNKSMSSQEGSFPKFFTTEVNNPNKNQHKSLKKDLSMTTAERMKGNGFTSHMSEKSIIEPDLEGSLMKKRLANLSLKNRKLAKFNSKVLESRSELQSLFISSVAEIKRQITLKRHIKDCSYEDFKKQDKINLLLTIISNQEILRFVYEKIFYNRDYTRKQNSVVLDGGVDLVATGAFNSTHTRKPNPRSNLPFI